MLGAIVLAAGGYLSTVDIGAYSELRMRIAPGDTAPFVAADFFTMPYARFEAKSRRVDFKFSYAAQVTAADLEQLFTTPIAPDLFQMADMSVWYTSRHWVLGASQGGTIGQMNFSFLTPYTIAPGQQYQGPPPVQPVPCVDPKRCASETVTYVSSATAVVLRYSYRHSSFALSPSFGVNGGLDEASRALVPLVSTPRVDLAFEQRVSRRDAFVTQSDATAAESTQRACDPATGFLPKDPNDPNPPLCAPSEQWVGLREVWRHSFTRRVQTEILGGATVARWTINETNDLAHNNPAVPYRVVPYPVFGAVLTYMLQNVSPIDRPAMHPVVTDPPRPAAYVYARVGPVVDTHYGIVDPRLEIGAAILQPIDENYTVMGHVGFMQSVWGSSLDGTYLAGSGEVRRRLDKYRFEIGLGARAAYNRDPYSGEFWAANVFVSLLWHEPRFVL